MIFDMIIDMTLLCTGTLLPNAHSYHDALRCNWICKRDSCIIPLSVYKVKATTSRISYKCRWGVTGFYPTKPLLLLLND